MNFSFCFAVLFVLRIDYCYLFLGTSADHNDNRILVLRRSSTIGNSGLKRNATRGNAANGRDELGKNIVRRSSFDRASVCKLPIELYDSDIHCKADEGKLTCVHTCPYGYAFKEGVIQRKMMCYYRTNTWTPVPEFEECKPFVDCSLSMIWKGKVDCKHDFFSMTACNVSCEPYEGNYRAPEYSYYCDIQGRWEPKLPHCVEAGSTAMRKQLIPPPIGAKQLRDLY